METKYPDVKTALGMIDDLENSERIAVISQGREISYRDLIARAKGTALALVDNGVKKGDRIVLSMQYTENMIIAVMAILYAGAAYVAIDRTWPKERLDFIYEDSGACLVLTDEVFLSLQGRQTTGSLPKVEGTDLMAVYYTSGSTGIPKGAIYCHDEVRYAIQSVPENVFFDESETQYDNVFSISNFAYVGKITDIFFSLPREKTLILSDDEERLSPVLIGKHMMETKADLIMGTPSTILRYLETPEFTEAFRNLKRVLFYGEPLSQKDLSFLAERTGAAFYSTYGSSELPAGALARVVPGKQTVFEFPYYGSELVVIDETGVPVDDGMEGELGLAGPGSRSAHYLGNPELDRQKYIYVSGYGRTFRTGDRAVKIDGIVRLLGRIDDMQKLRGQRVEPGEVEQAIEKFPGIREAAAAIRGEAKTAVLCAWYCTDNLVDPLELKRYLTETLPGYMVPERMMELRELPLTSSGKLDRRSLPDIVPDNTEYEAPKNQQEEELCRAFAHVLKLSKPVGRNDNFFLNGGDSILSMMLVYYLSDRKDHMPGNAVSSDLIMKYPTPAMLAKAISGDPSEKEDSTDNAAVVSTSASCGIGDSLKSSEGKPANGIFEHSKSTEALLNRDNVEAVYPVSNHTLAFLDLNRYKVLDRLNELRIQVVVNAAWTEEELQNRILKLIENHPALRSEFVNDPAGEYWQVFYRNWKPSFYYRNLCHLQENDQERFLRGFWQVLGSNSALWKLGYFVTGDGKSVVLLSASHTIMDAISGFVFLNELCAASYADLKPDHLLEHRRRLLQGNRDVPSWIHSYYADAKAPLKNPVWSRQSVTAKAGETFGQNAFSQKRVELTDLESAALLEKCQRVGVSPYEWIQYSYGKALLEQLDKDEIWIMTLESGRYEGWEDELRIIGNLILWLPVRIYKDQSLNDFKSELSILRSFPSLSDARIAYNNKFKGIYEGVVSYDFIEFLPPISHAILMDEDNRSGNSMTLRRHGRLIIEMHYSNTADPGKWYEELAGRVKKWLMLIR